MKYSAGFLPNPFIPMDEALAWQMDLTFSRERLVLVPGGVVTPKSHFLNPADAAGIFRYGCWPDDRAELWFDQPRAAECMKPLQRISSNTADEWKSLR